MAFLNAPRHRLVRAPINPLDKSTIVSIYPKRLDETKPTLQPSKFIIEPGSYENPSILVVGTASWWKEIDPEQAPIEITNSSVLVAESVVNDYCNGILGCNMGDKRPGLFWVPGEKTVAQIKTEFKNLLDIAKVRQTNWFMELVKLADVLWSRTNGNPLAIGDDMRLAAEYLQLKDKPWMQDFATIQLQNCPACGSLRNNNFPVCANCKTIIDEKRFKELGLKVAS